jgi:hypothetical protein
MAVERDFIELNRKATERIRQMGALSEAQMARRVGEHWTVAMALAHLGFWERRVIFVLEGTRREGKVWALELDGALNDLLLPFWAALPGQGAARLALEMAEEADRQLAELPEALLERVFAYNPRWVKRYLHRNTHLDEVEAALNSKE